MNTRRIVQNALKILDAYDFSVPLHRFLPGYFKQHKYMGSRDRRQASSLVYNYFRFGAALSRLDIEARLALADFVCNDTLSPVYADFFNIPRSEEKLTLIQRMRFLSNRYPDFNVLDFFPLYNLMSGSINKLEFAQTLPIQPSLFIRVSENIDIKHLKAELKSREIDFIPVPGNRQALQFANGTKLNDVADWGLAEFGVQPFEIQDLSSQQCGTYFKPKSGERWWDACAGAGGKSLMLKEACADVTVLATDKRESILRNYESRLDNAGFGKFITRPIDLAKYPLEQPIDELFDGIIADVPCSGSGTWGRTPEMTTRLKPDDIAQYHNLQFKLVNGMWPNLKPGKPLFYITCSVFAQENEEVVNRLIEQTPLTLDSMQVIKGYYDRADTLFIAKLILPA